MVNETSENLTMAKISKEAIRDGLATQAEQLAKQLETALMQIDVINAEIDAINELQTESSTDPETQDQPFSTQTTTPHDLELVNQSEDE